MPTTDTRSLTLGGTRPLDGSGETLTFRLHLSDLCTHAAVLGMTGSGKTGLLLVLVEEALLARTPVLMIDVKGDLPNLLLTAPADAPDAASLARWNLGPADVARLRASAAPRVITPGSTAGEPLHMLSALELPSPLWGTDLESARQSLSASISLLLQLLGRDPDPTRSRDHVLLSVLAERRLRAGLPAGVRALLDDVRAPPLAEIGALPLNEFIPRRERAALIAALNTLLASPTFEAWRRGATLDVGAWLAPRADGRTPAVIVSVAHLDDEERGQVVGVVLEQVRAWVRAQRGSSELRALLVFDELYGFAPPHPANPPAKRPLLSLMKQARAFGLGVIIATQNPMDLDYRALSNAGVWFVGRLQTDADRARVVEAMAAQRGGEAGAADGASGAAIAGVLKVLAPRWFVMRNARRVPGVALLQSRTTLCSMRGPMTRGDLRESIAAAAEGERAVSTNPGTCALGAASPSGAGSAPSA